MQRLVVHDLRASDPQFILHVRSHPGLPDPNQLILLSDVGRPLSLLAATVLFFTYCAAQSIALLRGLDVPCACFGSCTSGDRIGAASLARTLVLLAASAMLLVVSWGRRPQEIRNNTDVEIV